MVGAAAASETVILKGCVELGSAPLEAVISPLYVPVVVGVPEMSP